MNKALELAQEIRRKQSAVQKTKSEKLKRDYSKSIVRSIRDLKYYCKAMNLDYVRISEEFTSKLP